MIDEKNVLADLAAELGGIEDLLLMVSIAEEGGANGFGPTVETSGNAIWAISRYVSRIKTDIECL